MKKFLCLFMAVLTIICSCAVAGCDKDNIVYDAEKPMIEFETEYYEYSIESEEKAFWTLKGYEPLERFDYFKNFSEYYSEKLKGNSFYLLKCMNEKISPLPPYDKYGYVYFINKQTNEIVIYESFDYLDKELGGNDCGAMDGCKSRSLSLEIYIKPFKEIETNSLIFEFGKISGDVVYDKYINVYFGEKCFATCYYSNYVTVPREWFENYFKTNLIYGDDL